MRLVFRVFAFLDVVSSLLMSMQLWAVAKNYAQFSLLSDKIQGALMFPMFILVLVGAVGLFLQKKFGAISYYIQFPFRLYLWVFTFGFITLIPEAVGNFDDKWFPILLKVCFATEIIRLYLTIKAHLGNKLTK